MYEIYIVLPSQTFQFDKDSLEVIPRIGEEIRYRGSDWKVVRIVHNLVERTITIYADE